MSFTLSRRAVLRGLGVSLPLPFLDVMAESNALRTPKRYVALFKPNGVHPPAWQINNSREFDFELSALMSPLEPHKQDVLIFENIGKVKARGHVGMNFLCGAPGKKALGASMDQVLAKHLGGSTPVRSLELTTEGIFTGKPDCSYISYDDKGRFLPRESDPQLVFDKLFRSPFNNGTARRQLSSVLDGVKDNSAFLNRRIGRDDQQILDEFYTMVRETEKKIERSTPQGQSPLDTSKLNRPGAGANLDEQVNAMLDVIALALWTDSTRVASYMLGNDNSRLVFDFLGVTEQHHYLSHFFQFFSVGNVDKLNKINLWHTEKYAYLLDKLKSYRDGEGTLLDNTVAHFGSGMGNSDAHSGSHIPHIMAGGKGLIKTGRCVNHSTGQPVHALLLSLMQRFGLELDSFQKEAATMDGLHDSNYEKYVKKPVTTFFKKEKDLIKMQGVLRMNPDINKPRIHLIDIKGAGTVRIEVPFGMYNEKRMGYFCGKPVYLEGQGSGKDGDWVVTKISKLQGVDE